MKTKEKKETSLYMNLDLESEKKILLRYKEMKDGKRMQFGSMQ